MTKLLKNKKHLIITSIIAIISLVVLLIVAFFAYVVWAFGSRKDVTYKDCGNQTYELFRDFEGFWIMHNTKNEKMNKAGNDIIYHFDKQGITSILSIEKGEEEYITFVPENNKVEDWEVNALTECYPNSEMILLTNIRDVQIKPGFIEQQYDEEKLR